MSQVKSKKQYFTHTSLLYQRKANEHLVKDTQYTVMGLTSLRPYEFRVVAQNAAGPSEHSLPSMAATPKDPDGMI